MGAGPDISIVLPAHNEAGNIAPIAAAIAQVMALQRPVRDHLRR